jgi:hypothetical protein
MSDLREARDPEREPQIDNVGWLFLALAAAIIVMPATTSNARQATGRPRDPQRCA